MKLLMEYQNGFNAIEEFTGIDCSESESGISIGITRNSYSEWLYHYDIKNGNELEFIKAHIQKIFNQLLELDYIKTTDFPIEGIKGDFYLDWKLN